jgi:hypothetical protein
MVEIMTNQMVGTAIILAWCILLSRAPARCVAFLADTNFREDITRPWRNQEK